MNPWRAAFLLGRALSLLLALFALSPWPSRANERIEADKGSPSREDFICHHTKDIPIGPARLDLGGQARLRYEYDDGFTLKGYEPGGHDVLLLQRVRLDVDVRLPQRIRMFFQVQDAHAFLTRYGDDDFPKSNPLEDTFDLRQAYLEWLGIRGSPIGFRVGRQQISYGDQRFFGPGNWGNTGRYAWDAAMLKLETSAVSLDCWVGRYLQYKSSDWPNRAIEDFFTAVGYAHFQKLPFRLDVFYVYKEDSSGAVQGETGSTGNIQTHSVGFQAEGDALGFFHAGASFAGQGGQWAKDTVRAFGANAKLGAKMPLPWSPEITAQYTWGSGDRDPNDGVHGTFDGVFGGRDIYFYGYLNLFFWANLRDAELNLSFKPHPSITAFVAYHHFELDQEKDAWYTTGLKPFRRDSSGQAGTQLGDEIDLRLVWAIGHHLELSAGYGRLVPGNFVRRTGPSGPANWSFCQILYSF